MQMRYENNGKFEKMFPKTVANNVSLNNGLNVEQWKKEVDDFINEEKDGSNNQSSFEILWRGEELISTNTIKPSKKLTECPNGWLLVFRNASGMNNFSYHYIPKWHVLLESNEGIKILAGSSGGSISQKYLIIPDGTTIKGISLNGTGDNAKTVLFRVLEY